MTIEHYELYEEILLAQIQTPSGTHQEAAVTPITNDHSRVMFSPLEPGPHLIHVHAIPTNTPNIDRLRLGPESQYEAIEHSPFNFWVGSGKGQPHLVRAKGGGLHGGKVGRLLMMAMYGGSCGFG